MCMTVSVVTAVAMAAPAGDAVAAIAPDDARQDINRQAKSSRLDTSAANVRLASRDVGDVLAGANLATVKAAIKEARAGNTSAALAREANLGDPAARTLIDWMVMRYGKGVDFATLARFIADHPHWPEMDAIRSRAEQELLTGPFGTDVVHGHLAKMPPRSIYGRLALARVHLEAGDRAAAAGLVRALWTEETLGEAMESRILKGFGELLRDEDHGLRLVNLIYRHETTAALRQAKRMSSAHVAMAEAARLLINGDKGGPRALNKVPERLRGQLVMRYALARYHRRNGDEAKAREIVLAVPVSHQELSNPDVWWTERKLLARGALARSTSKAWPDAYRLAAAHGFASGTPLAEGEFLAGWIALRFLKRPDTAIKHFRTILERDDKDMNLSQAHYWLARSYLAMGRHEEADRHLRAGAKYPRTYYGQLSRGAIGEGTKPIAVPDTPPVADTVKAAVGRDDVVRAIRMLAATDNYDLLPQFFTSVLDRFSSVEERAALASIAWDIGQPNLALRMARLSLAHGIDMGAYAYPRHAMPKYRRVTPQVEEALLYGLIRQESEFNPKAVSWAGARGMMQIMPATGKLIARQHRQKYDVNLLTTDPSYNVTLGHAHLHDLLQSFNGSYIMTLVAYNAGPGRVKQWIERYGDPRKGEVDPVDWVEMIPFSETRHYVKRVLENVQVYRSRLAPATMVPLRADLERGRFGAPSVTDVDIEAAASTGCNWRDLGTIEGLIACND